MNVTERVIRVLAPYSEGCRLAMEHGPLSGVSFEYACENIPHGSGIVGRWIDRRFLQLSGSDTVRKRVRTKKEIVMVLLAKRRAQGLPTTILDLASGTARPLREICIEDGGSDLTVVCHDRDPRKVMHGRELASREKLGNVIFAVGDATDSASYVVVHEPDIVMACGLFPLLASDGSVQTVMKLAFEHLTPGGTFVCTAARAWAGATDRWESPMLSSPTDRDPTIVAGWLRATGFNLNNSNGAEWSERILVGTKPESD